METDLHLLSRYHRHGDAEAFQALVTAHAGMVHATAQRVTRNAALAQENFLALARNSGAANKVGLADNLITVFKRRKATEP